MDWLPVAARLLQYVGAVVLFGAPLFFLYGLSGRQGRAVVRRAWPGWAFALACLLILVGGTASLALETASMSGDAADAYKLGAIWTVLSDTRFGHGMGVRIALSGLALPVSVLPLSRGQWSLLAVLGAGVLISFGWTGHGMSDEGTAGLIHLGADIVHLLAAGVWLGALVVLAVLLSSRSLRDDGAAAGVLHQGLSGFSGVGTLVVALLVLTGLANSWFLIGLGHLGALVGTPYGLALLVKLALFTGMLALAAHNRFTLTPRLEQALQVSPGKALGALRWSVGVETATALGVLAVVALLGTLPPASMG